MAKIHINSHTTNIFLHQFAILWVICVGEGWGLFSEEEPHGLALVPYVGGVAYGAEAVCVFEDFEHVGDVVRRFVGRFGVGYAVEVRAQNHPVAIVDSVFDALFHLCFSEPSARERFKRQSLQTVSVVVGIVVDKVVGGSHGTFKKLFHDGHIVGELC